MRQAGVIAAAARVALADRDRLGEDHELARTIGLGFAERYPDAVDPDLVETNMVRVDFTVLGVSWEEMRTRLADAGIKINPPMAGAWRIVTHRNVDFDDGQRLLAAIS